jgi:hypothetical protein
MLSQNLITHLAGYHEASTACPLANAREEEVRRRFGKRPEAYGVDPNHEGLIDDCLKLSLPLLFNGEKVECNVTALKNKITVLARIRLLPSLV